MEKIKATYSSPRWSGELLDCSMPMTFDQYSRCSFNCVYCFSFFQKIYNKGMSEKKKKDYAEGIVTSVNAEKVIENFRRSLNGEDVWQFSWYIKNRYVMQWGGLADPFDLYERKFGVGLKLLRFFREIEYPISFSTKGTWWIEDKRYRELFEENSFWNVKVSIISLEEKVAKVIERGCPTVRERLDLIEKLSNIGILTTLRLRPFIPKISDKTYLSLIKEASNRGAKAVSTEFFCLSTNVKKERFKPISELAGIDIWDFYKRLSPSRSSFYKRLNYEYKRPYFKKMEELCKELGLRFYVSDAHHKERCNNGSCCGLPENSGAISNYFKGQFTYAIVLAKKKGEVRFSDLEGVENWKKIPWSYAQGLNTHNQVCRLKRKNWTVYDYVKFIWNSPENSLSPYKYFEGMLIPYAKDKEGNLIYKFNREKYGR